MENEIAQIVASYGVTLYDTEVAKEGDNTIFRVYVVKDGGVDLDLCAKISRELSPFLDINPPISGNYFLEVSSPGIERKLKNLQHFQYSQGEKVYIKLLSGDKLKGIIEGVEDSKIKIKTDFGVEEFDLGEIKTARTYFDW
ncbi:MAG: ribosome maturation factor RimP [Campylobacterota bacterium]